jgi:hypothetical protein
MHMNERRKPQQGMLLRLGLLAGVMLTSGVLLAPAADHRDGPIFVNTAVSGRHDLNDIYIFQAPGNINNTVIIVTVSPFPGVLTPISFDPSLIFEVNVDNNGDAIEDKFFRMTFSAAGANGVQQVTLRGFPATAFPNGGLLAKGLTGQNLNIVGGGRFRAANHDDAFFFDAGAFSTFVANGQGGFPRNPGKNFFKDANTLACIIEVPTSMLRAPNNNPNVGVWMRSVVNGKQIDRMGRPAINTALIPPVPRNNLARGERRNAFNAGHPKDDNKNAPAGFRDDMISVLMASPFSRPAATAAGLADFLLPDILTFNTSTAFTTDQNDGNGFPNGRRLRDDVIDIELNLLTGSAITSDFVNDDNGDLITDGTAKPGGGFRPILFPYLGPPNVPSGPPNP